MWMRTIAFVRCGPPVVVAIMALLGNSCCIMGEDPDGPGNFDSFNWRLSGAKTDEQEQAAIYD
jgi:hypothetical protein